MSAPAWRRYLRFWRADVDADVDDELRFHIESRFNEYLASGMTADEARAATIRRFGDVERVRKHCQQIDHLVETERRRADMWDAFTQDLRYAARGLRRNPAFTAVAVLTLALGIGANTAIFSVVNGVLLRPLPYADADRLVQLYTAFRGQGETRYTMSQPEFMDYKGLTHVFENAAAYTGAGLTLTGSGDPERLRGIAATRDLLPVLGVSPVRGRNFQNDEGRQGTDPVVILTHELWQTRFGGDAGVLGRRITLNDISRLVIGILPPGTTVSRAQAIIPFYIQPDSMTGRSNNYLNGVARLRPNVTVEQAQRELNALTARLQAEHRDAYPASMGFGATVANLRDEIVGDVRPALVILLGAVGLVLLIACANVANLLLARGEARHQEIAVRTAMGASRGRVLRQLLTESTLLALLGAVAGAIAAWWGLKTILAVNPEAIPRLQEVKLDLTVAAVTLGLALVTGIIFGLAPALQIIRPDLHASLKDGSRGGSASGQRQRLGRALVVGEIALAIVVVIGATLLMRSFWTLSNVKGGFDPRNVLAVDVSIPTARYDTQATTAFYHELLRRMRALPGVRLVGATSDLPPASGQNNLDIFVEGRAVDPNQAVPAPNVRTVTHDYFRTLSIPIVSGRGFTSEDRQGSLPVILINQTAARTIWPGENPVGQRVRFSPRRPAMTIVGVVGDTRSLGLDRPAPPELFLLHEQMPGIRGRAVRSLYVVAQTTGDPAALAPQARRVVRDLDPLLAVGQVTPMTDVVGLSLARPRFTMVLLGVFGGVSLALAAIGIYGIMAYAVRRRKREIGIRIALGAQPRAVQRLVLGQGMRLAAFGFAIGIVGAALATRLLTRLLYGISATDPLTFASIALVMAGVALVASWVPARRAVRTDPTAALRE